jgi:Tfp pilus assembly protein PilV
MLLKHPDRTADVPRSADILVCEAQPRSASKTKTSDPRIKRSLSAFTLIEVMIACGIFFMATFAILALVASSLRNARALQRGDVDAGMAAAQIFQLLKTNRQADLSGSGDFGEDYPGYTYEFASGEFMTNGLLQVDIQVNRRGLNKPVDIMTIWVYAPDARSGPGGPMRP